MKQGDIVAYIHLNTEEKIEESTNELLNIFKITKDTKEKEKIIFGVIK